MTKKLARPREGRMIAGVAAGIAKYTGIDVTIIRLIWVLLLLPGGLPGFIPYIILWIIMPQETTANGERKPDMLAPPPDAP